jgi:signal peptidase I
MEPALIPGDYLVATKHGAIRRGGLVVIARPAEPGFELVKRVGGVPGDVIDDRLLESNEYWVVGETLARSTDSRTFGAVTRAQIKGVVRLRYWPPLRAKWFLSGYAGTSNESASTRDLCQVAYCGRPAGR